MSPSENAVRVPKRHADEVDSLNREPGRVLLLERGVVVVGERVVARGLVTPLEERPEEVRADEPGGAGDDVAHGA